MSFDLLPYLLVDPAGVLHILGDITEDTDYAECGAEAGREWRAVSDHTDPDSPRCPGCASKAHLHKFEPVQIVTTKPTKESRVQ